MDENQMNQWLLNGSVISANDGKLLVGWGKRRKLSSPEDVQAQFAFYFPDFFLCDPNPWWEYEHTQEIEAGDLLTLLSSDLTSSNRGHAWTNQYHPFFCHTFERLKQQMSMKVLDKAVPFIFESSVAKMCPAQLQRSISNILYSMRDFPIHLYGFWDQSEGLLGATPEVLFQYFGKNCLQTMACAGTGSRNDCEKKLLSDPKLSHEHQLVVQGIAETLAPFGKVHIGERHLLALPTITHVLTPITAELNHPPDFEKIVQALHPTPALGASPRVAGMHWLKAYQQQIDRRRFGAPVGYIKNDRTAICYVAIRNVQWDQDEMLIGAGCGVVPDSNCESEWAEIDLKLSAIKQMLAL